MSCNHNNLSPSPNMNLNTNKNLHTNINPNINTNTNTNHKHSQAFQQALHGIGLYVLCLILPNGASFLYNFIIGHVLIIRHGYGAGYGSDYSYRYKMTDGQYITLFTLMLSLFRMCLVRICVSKRLFVAFKRGDNNNSNGDSNGDNDAAVSAFMRTKSMVLLSDFGVSDGGEEDGDGSTMRYSQDSDIRKPTERMSLTPKKVLRSRQMTPNTKLRVKKTERNTRRATAVFRLSYSIIVTVFTVVCFRSSKFWFFWRLEKEHVANVWSLEEGISPLLLSSGHGYDEAGVTWTKMFYMIQIAYHLQSVCFQIWTLLLVWASTGSFFRTINGNGYRKSLFFHVTATILLALSYVFSCTRRLAILILFYKNLANIGIYLFLISEGNLTILWWTTMPLLAFSVSRVLSLWYCACMDDSSERVRWLYEFQHGLGVGNNNVPFMLSAGVNIALSSITFWFAMAAAKLPIIKWK